MREKVEQYLLKVEQYEQKLREKENKAKKEEEQKHIKEVLRQAGLIEKEYREKGGKKADYPLFDNVRYEYYREIVPELTEEEWQAVEAAYKRVQWLKKGTAETDPAVNPETRKTGNGVAKALRVIAVFIYIGALIGGIVTAAVIGSGVGAGIMFGFWFSGFVFGTSMLGFAEIINLLDHIDRK